MPSDNDHLTTQRGIRAAEQRHDILGSRARAGRSAAVREHGGPHVERLQIAGRQRLEPERRVAARDEGGGGIIARGAGATSLERVGGEIGHVRANATGIRGGDGGRSARPGRAGDREQRRGADRRV
ncbi:MAG TPA: hypothetical protein VKH19_11545 [Gemmatimonadaceae bacterium]|nr:hypothetical protein [Gemmatimonadaceae bacterium]